MEHEDTGEPVLCPICDAEEYNDCGHLVATFDLTFGECEGGEFYAVQHECLSALESAFQKRHANEASGPFADEMIEDIWTKVYFEDDGEGGLYCHLPMADVLRLFECFLDEAGAFSAGSDIAHNGPPGMSSSYMLLSAPEPAKVVSAAKQALLNSLNDDPND